MLFDNNDVNMMCSNVFSIFRFNKDLIVVVFFSHLFCKQNCLSSNVNSTPEHFCVRFNFFFAINFGTRF